MIFKKIVMKALGLWAKLPKSRIVDVIYCKLRYYITFKKKLDLRNPKSFNEKIQWLKFNSQIEYYYVYADKYNVRDYVKDKIGDKYLIPLIDKYESVNDIEFKDLPNSFVLKAVHGSGWNIVCRDKKKLNWSSSKSKLDKWMNQNYFFKGREPVYYEIKPKIICEKFIEPTDNEDLKDFKIFCFNGDPKFVQVDIDRYTNHSRNIYDLNWKKQSYGLCYPISSKNIPKPSNLNKMIDIASKLSEDITLCRVDLYNVKGKIYFGEMTFLPGNGFEKFSSNEIDEYWGNILKL